MAKIDVRYLVTLPGKGGLPRYFWQPSSALRRAGFASQRIPDAWWKYSDAGALEAAACAKAQELNRALDAKREGTAPAIVIESAGKQTVAQLIKLYKASDEFEALEASTRRGYRQCLTKIEAWCGDAPVRALTPDGIHQWYKAMRVGTPAYAAASVRVLRLLLGWCRLNCKGWISVNAAEDPQLQGAEPSGVLWPREAIGAFVAAADFMGWRSVGTAVLLNEWIGQRQGDVLRLPARIYRGGALTFRQSKRGAGVALPIDMVPHLKARLDEATARQGIINLDAPLLICETTGEAWKADHFRHIFAEVRAEAAREMPVFDTDYLMPGRDIDDPKAFVIDMAELTYMHLRHTAITRLAEAECTTALISAISGHSIKSVEQILRHYLVRTRAQAVLAFQKRLDAEGHAPAPASNKEQA